MLAAVTVPSPLEESFQQEAVEQAHEGLIFSSTQLSELCQEPLSDMGLARVAKLVTQVSHDLALTIEARKASSV